MSDWGGLGNSPFAERADLEAAPYQYMGGKVPKERKNRRKLHFLLCRQPFLQYTDGNKKAFTYYQPPRTITRLQLRRFSRTRVTHARIPWQFRLFAFTTFTISFVFWEKCRAKGRLSQGTK